MDGWKMERVGSNYDIMELYRTKDGGENWVKIACTIENSTTPKYGEKLKPGMLPYESGMYGISFLDTNTGWLTGFYKGFIGISFKAWIYVTHDGGYTWEQQEMPFPSSIMPEQNIGVFMGVPTFFTSKDGMINISVQKGEGKWGYVYFTHDGGHSWDKPQYNDIGVPSFSKGISKNIYWDLSSSDGARISIANDTWVTDASRIRWKKVNYGEMNGQVYKADGSHDGITINDIKRKYKPDEIISTTIYKDKYALIGSKVSTAIMYTFYNLSTGYMDILDTSSYYVKLENIENSNRIIFYANGQRMDMKYHNFPFIISFDRHDESCEFTKKEIPIFYHLNDAVTIGDAHDTLMISGLKAAKQEIDISFDSLNETQKPLSILNGQIPVTKIYYKDDVGQIVLEFEKAKIGQKVNKDSVKKFKEDCYYTSISFQESNEYCQVAINLKPTVKKYTAKISRNEENGLPYLSVCFSLD